MQRYATLRWFDALESFRTNVFHSVALLWQVCPFDCFSLRCFKRIDLVCKDSSHANLPTLPLHGSSHTNTLGSRDPFKQGESSWTAKPIVWQGSKNRGKSKLLPFRNLQRLCCATVRLGARKAVWSLSWSMLQRHLDVGIRGQKNLSVSEQDTSHPPSTGPSKCFPRLPSCWAARVIWASSKAKLQFEKVKMTVYR